MTEFIETPTLDAVLSFDVSKDEQGTPFALLVVHLESDKTVRLPMPVPVAMRVWALLDQARQNEGWQEPTTPVSTAQIQ